MPDGVFCEQSSQNTPSGMMALLPGDSQCFHRVFLVFSQFIFR
jgi:hypothetical protein